MLNNYYTQRELLHTVKMSKQWIKGGTNDRQRQTRRLNDMHTPPNLNDPQTPPRTNEHQRQTRRLHDMQTPSSLNDPQTPPSSNDMQTSHSKYIHIFILYLFTKINEVP